MVGRSLVAIVALGLLVSACAQGTSPQAPNATPYSHVHAAIHLRASSNGDTLPYADRPADPDALPGSADTYAAPHLYTHAHVYALPDRADPHAAPHLYPCADPYPVSDPDSTANGNSIPNPQAHTDAYPRTPAIPTPRHAE